MTSKDILPRLKKHPFVAVCSVLIVILAAVYFFRKAALPDAEGALAQKTTESRRLKSNITNSAQLKEHLASLEEANRTVDGRLMRAADLAKNQQYFYKIESETGVKLTDLRPTPGAAAPAKNAPKTLYSSVPYACTVQGTYEQLLNFLRRLERGEHFQRIKSANVSLAGGSGDDGSATDPILSLTIAIEFLGQS